MTPARRDLIEALSQVQNHPALSSVDILSITGCGMTDDEVRQHIEANMAFIAKANFDKAQEAPRKRRGA